VKEKLRSILFRRINAPSAFEIRLALRSFSIHEKIVFLFLAALFLTGVFGLWFKLQEKFAVLMPVQGGTVREGIIGTPHLANPILANTDADRDLTFVIYAGLMKSDGQGGLEKNLAEKYSISDDGLAYTFVLKENLVWHDGLPLTGEDVAFTIMAAKNPSIKSPIRANWEGVEAEVVDERTIRFILKKPYVPFMENTTLGILPKHIWKNATPDQFSLSEFNRQPIGAGPYMIKKVNRNSAGIITSYELKAFGDYALGRPLIPKIELIFYNSENELIAAFKNNSIDSLSSVSSQTVRGLKMADNQLKTLTLPRIFGLFFNQNKSTVLRDQKVRQALNMAVNKEKLVNEILNGFGVALNGPIPPPVLAFEKQTSDFNLEEAKKILDAAGWKIDDKSGIRAKTDKKSKIELAFNIATANTPELAKSADMLKNMWQELGVKIEIKFFEIGDLNQNIIRPREYESLLFGQVIGRNPDLFAFWHSSQRNDPGLNVALYANKTADQLLEATRITKEVEDRRNKYEKFQQEIEKDAPAIFLYSPFYLYVAHPDLKGFATDMITIPAERFANINKWHLYTARVWKIFAH
jgi:peptide/nickel transport system substrate-binding protein